MAFKVFQRKDGRYAVKYKEEKTGKWVQRTFKTEEEANQLALELEEDQLQNNRMTVAEVMLSYVQNHQELSATRKKMYATVVDGGYADGIADKFVNELTRRDLELVRNCCRERGIKNQTINFYTSLLSSAFNWGTEQELIPDNPWRKYRPLKVVERGSLMASPEDFETVYKALPPYMQWACRTCLALCLRPGKELVYLKWESFDFKRGCVKVYMYKIKQNKIVFPPEQYLAEALERKQASHSPYVVTGARGKERTPHSLRMSWNYTCKKVGISIPMYCMRHLAASLSLEGGGDLVAVASQLGHKSPTTTGKFYLHSFEEGQKKAGKALALPYSNFFGKK